MSKLENENTNQSITVTEPQYPEQVIWKRVTDQMFNEANHGNMLYNQENKQSISMRTEGTVYQEYFTSVQVEPCKEDKHP